MEENNKIIAEFMGCENSQAWELIPSPYECDWNWLMDVVEKILNICAENDDLEKYAVITDNIPYIQPTYNECVRFINFYNKQKEE
jgi:hypothetical protein